MSILKVPVTFATTGTAGSAAGNGTTPYPLVGYLHAIHFDLTGAAATADITVTEVASGSAPTQTILTLTDYNTTGFKLPRIQVCGVTGTALTLDGTRLLVDRMLVSGYLKTAVAQSDAATVIVTYYIEC